MPISLASGCLIDYGEKRILLTVQHATGDMDNWAAEIKFEQHKGTKLYQLGSMNFLKSISINKLNVTDVDFSYIEVPKGFESFHQEIDPSGNISSEIPRKICTALFDVEPSSNESFGFSGQVVPERVGNLLITQHRVYDGLKYKESIEDYHVFELPGKHPGHEHFQGCSGAPIIDTKGNAVALVCKGDEDKNLIYGVSLKKYEVAIAATYGNLKSST